LVNRRISEVQRNRDRDRSFYEELTREIRFDTYKAAIKSAMRYLNVSASQSRWQANPVLLGHNRQDTWENMLSNIAKGQKYEQLRGMDSVGEEQGVLIWRPLLNVDKTDIYNDAEALGVPHLWDSTPSWCDRGQMRDVVIPFLNQTMPLLIPGLERLSEQLGFLSFTFKLQFEEYWKTVNIDDQQRVIKAPLSPWVFSASPMWTSFFKRLYDRWSLPPPSHKSLDLMHLWLQRARDGHIRGRTPAYELSKNYKAYYSPRELTIVVRIQCTSSQSRRK